MIYLYGLMPGGARPAPMPAGLAGVTGAVHVAEAGPFRVIHGAAGTEAVPAKRRFMLAHARTLEAFASVAPVLPMRFGMTAPDIGTVASMLSAQADVLTEAFDRIAGQAEFGVRVTFPRDAALCAALAAHPALAAERDRLALGRADIHAAADLGRRLAEALDRRRSVAQRDMVARLEDLWTRYVLRTPESDVQVLAVDALLSPDGAGLLAECAEAAARACGFAPGAEPQVRVIGPAPPYSFVSVALPSEPQEAA